MLPVVCLYGFVRKPGLLLDGKYLLEREAFGRNVEVLVHGISGFDPGDLAVYSKEGRTFRADGEQVVTIVQDTDAEGADPVRGAEHLHVHGFAAVRAGNGFRTTKESDGV